MRTAEREASTRRTSALAVRSPLRRTAGAAAGPALIGASVLIAMRGFAFADALSNQHPDILSFWLPRSCLLGRSLAAGHVPLWNPFEMAGTPFAADPQSGWLYLPWMLLSWLLPCGAGLRAFIVLQPILAGLGLYWFLRRERLHRITATVGGLSLAMMIAASNLAISLPFAATLAWTPFVLVGASGFLSNRRWSGRLGWLALGALAWGQVASAHLSHGLLVCTAVVTAYVASRTIQDIRAGGSAAPVGIGLALLFLAFLPLANLAILVPRFALIPNTSLRGGYAALGGTLARISGVEDRPLPTSGVWSAWPVSLASAPGAYAGAIVLLSIPAAFRATGRRYMTIAFVAAGGLAYALTLDLFVGAAWFRDLVLRLPFGDVYLHNPGRLRHLVLFVGPVLGAIGLQGFLDRLPSRREAAWWIGGAAALFVGLPVLLGANPERFVIFALAAAASVPILFGVFRGRRWAATALPLVLAAELLAGALWSSAYRGGTVYVGLEGHTHPVLAPQPLRWPEVPLDRYLEVGPIARYLQDRARDARYLSWIPPAAYFNKGYLFSQEPQDWAALLLGRGVLFHVHDALGYSPIQLPRYWSYIRTTNQLPVFYNAAVLQLPELQDLRLLGVRYVVGAQGVGLPPGLSGSVVASQRGYDLYEVTGSEPRVSVVSAWTEVPGGVQALEAIRDQRFDPGSSAVVEGHAGLPAGGQPDESVGVATYRETVPEEIWIRASANAPSVVVVRNAWDGGWSATVDGRPAPVLRTDYFLQGVTIPAGTHQIRLTYRDPMIGRGLLLSGPIWLGWLAALAASVIGDRRRSRAAHGPPETDGIRG